MKSFFLRSVGQKYLMGFSGLGLIVFVLVHMLGNLFIFAGPKAYNMYAHTMTQSWILIPEIGLVILFICHIIFALILSVRNYTSRPISYSQSATGWKATHLYQKTLLAQGAVVLVFVILHLITFKFGTHYEVTYDGKVVRDLFLLVQETFQKPLLVLWYLLALGVLFFHLLHGLESSLKSLGVAHPQWQSWIRYGNWCYASFVILGYLSQPIYIYFFF